MQVIVDFKSSSGCFEGLGKILNARVLLETLTEELGILLFQLFELYVSLVLSECTCLGTNAMTFVLVFPILRP